MVLITLPLFTCYFCDIYLGHLSSFDIDLKVLLQGEIVMLDVLLQVLGLLQQVLATNVAVVVHLLRHRLAILKKTQNRCYVIGDRVIGDHFLVTFVSWPLGTKYHWGPQTLRTTFL